MHVEETPGQTIIYCRISADPTGQELGVQRQEEECRALAERNGWTVDRVIVDNDLSATSGKARQGFEELLSSAPKRILCWHTDRLVRLSADLERVLDLGVPVYTVSSGHLDLSNPAGRAVARTITAWATYEGEQKAARQRAAHEQRRRNGGRWWMNRPFGYELDGTLREDEAEAIRHAHADLLSGKPLRAIAREWEARSFLSSRGNPMAPSTVRDILMHPRNAGKITYRGKIVGDGDWTPIVDELTLYAVRKHLMDPERTKATSTRRRGLLSGLLWCAMCGSRCHLYRTGGREYYTCSGRHCVSWPIDWLDEYVSTTVKLVLDTPEWRPAWDQDPRAAVAGEEVVRYEQLLDELMEDRLSGVLSREQWEKATKSVQERLQEARTALSGTNTPKHPSQAARKAYSDSQRWEQLTVDEQREVIKAVYTRITLGRSGRTRWRDPDSTQIQLGV